MTKQSVLVLGAGSWGTALSLVLARNGHQVYLWGIDPEHIEELKETHCNSRYLPDVALPMNILPIKTMAEVPKTLRLVVNAVPCQGLRGSLEQLGALTDLQLCIACKGFEPNTQKLNHIVAQEVLPHCSVAVLSGPSFAREVAAGLPTAVALAATDEATAKTFVALFHSDVYRVYTQADMIGVQVCGAVKNVMAIAAGIADGLGFGANARAALQTRGLVEIRRLGLAMGASGDTFLSLAGVGDLVLTCTDDQSRNRRLGLLLAEGLSVAAAQAKIGQAIEGLKTAIAVGQLADQHQLEMPITAQVIKVLQAECTPQAAVQSLLAREPKAEGDL